MFRFLVAVQIVWIGLCLIGVIPVDPLWGKKDRQPARIAVQPRPRQPQLPARRGDKVRSRALDALVERYFPPEARERAKRIVRCENPRMDPSAVGDRRLAFTQDGVQYGKSYGLFQIRHLPGRPDPDWLSVPENNVRYAAMLYQAVGWEPWTCHDLLQKKIGQSP